MKSPPPPAFGSGLLARALAYREQEKALGGLSSVDHKRIRRAGGIARSPGVDIAPHLRPGTWLTRHWHGKVHQVVILESGVEYRGKNYASLSAVAREITGARWSGPRFFGLKSPRLKAMGTTEHA